MMSLSGGLLFVLAPLQLIKKQVLLDIRLFTASISH